MRTQVCASCCAFGRQDLSQLRQLGIVAWSVESWSIRPALNAQYIIVLDRALITLSSDLTGFYTHGFGSSNVTCEQEANLRS